MNPPRLRFNFRLATSFTSALPDVVKSFMKVMEKAGAVARFIKKTVP
jgi:hypothetical protein